MAYNPKTGKGLGRFYSAEHRAFRAREWRGFRDTFYDFFRWLYLYGFMAAKLGCHPILMVKAMLRYRWMVSYLTAAHMVDRHTMGLRGKELRYAHNQFFSVLHNSVLGVRDIILRDKNLRPNSKHAAKLRENTVMFDEMTPHLIMMGFPTVKWIDIAMFAIGLPSEVDQNASMFYIDAMEHLGLPADVCPEPAAESGCAVVDDYPRVGKCYFTGTMPCDGAISQTNILTRHFKELPSFQITPPQRVNEPEVQTYAVKNLKKGIEFLEQQFGVKWDWDAFWKNAEMYNESSRCMIEKWDVNCTEHPQVCGAALALQREYEFMAAACMDKFMLKTDRRVTKMMLKGYEQDKAANAPQPKYRCLVWACPAHYYTNFTYWTQHCWGVTCVNDMEAMLSYQPITIGDKEQALADLVRCYEKMMMRSHTNGGYVNLLDECWKMCSTRTSSSCTTTYRARTSAVCTACLRIRRASAASTSSGSRTTSWIRARSRAARCARHSVSIWSRCSTRSRLTPLCWITKTHSAGKEERIWPGIGSCSSCSPHSLVCCFWHT